MFSVNEQRRGFYAIRGEGCSGRSGSVGDDERKVSATALFEASLGSSEAESAGNHKLGKIAHWFEEIRLQPRDMKRAEEKESIHLI